MGKNILMTGASGFLGKRLLEALLKRDDAHFYLLVRSKRSQEDLQEEMKWSDITRLHYMTGDITKPFLGFDEQLVAFLAREINEVWHLAASTDFDESKRAEIRHTNIEGTKNVLDISSHIKELERFYYMSTAYICGVNHGSISEDSMPLRNGFKNPYEESKYDCELLVHGSKLPFVIIRPSILTGESVAGDAKGENRMAYGYLLAIYHASLHAFGGVQQFWRSWEGKEYKNVRARIYTSSDVTKNFVTIDDAVRICMKIKESEDAVGKAYNVVNPENLSMGFIVDSMQRALRISGIQPDPALAIDTIEKHNVVEKVLYRYTSAYWPYAMHSEPKWIDDNVQQLGIKRVAMTEDLFDFLMERYVIDHLKPHVS